VTRWSWPRDLNGLLGQVLMESLWLNALAVVIATLAPSQLRLTYLTTAAPQLGCALLARLSLQLPLRLSVQRLLLLAAAASLLAVWLQWVIAPDARSLAPWGSLITQPWRHGIALSRPLLVITWLIGLYACARGLLAGLVVQTGPLVTRWFMIGAVLLLGLFLFLAGTGLPQAQLPIARLSALTAWYFVCGMLVVAFAQRRSLHARERLRPQTSFAFVLATGLPAALVAIGALLLVGGRRAMRWIMELTLEGVDWAIRVLWLVARMLGLMVHALMDWLRQFGGSGVPRSRNTAIDRVPPALELWSSQPGQWSAPEWNALPVLLLAAAALLVVLVLSLLFRARARALADEAQEESESLWSWALMQQQWSAAAQRLLSGWRSRQARLLLRVDAAEGQGDATLHDIGQVYRAMLRWAALHGHPRARSTTTLELAAALASDRALGKIDVALITSSYNDAHYGAQAVPEPELESARQQLRALLTRRSYAPPTAGR
jgi:hypothetical protein